MAQRVLFVLTSNGTLGDNGDRTGFHLAELTHPYYVLRDAGYDVNLGSINGGHPPVDPGSEDYDDETNRRFRDDAEAQRKLAHSTPVTELDGTDFSAIYFPGGHGTMWDLPDNPDVQRLIREVWENGGTVGAVCHGPAALVNATLGDGTHLVDGRQVSAFTDEEEQAVKKDGIVPFLLATELKGRGAKHRKAENFQPSVSIDGRLVTGQNPASAQGVGEAIRDLLASEAD